MIQRRNFFAVPPGSILFYWAVVEPAGCANLRLEHDLNGEEVGAFNTQQLADELEFAPILAGQRLVLPLDVAFLAAGKVSILATLRQPDGTIETRTPITIDGVNGTAAAATVTVTA